MEQQPKISILYDGAYSSQLNWRTDRLAEFANKSDLRTNVYIVTGDEIDRPQVNILGDTLAWSNILSAANPFVKKDLNFEEIDITKDQKLMEEMLKKSNQMTVPVFDINGQILVGFNRTKLEEALIKVA